MMGVRGDGVLGVHNKVLNAYKLLKGDLPELVQEMEMEEMEEDTYFSFQEWKMYGYNSVDEFHEWLDTLEDLLPLHTGRVYGYMEMMEGDISTYGDPTEFEIYSHTAIDSPIN